MRFNHSIVCVLLSLVVLLDVTFFIAKEHHEGERDENEQTQQQKNEFKFGLAMKISEKVLSNICD